MAEEMRVAGPRFQRGDPKMVSCKFIPATDGVTDNLDGWRLFIDELWKENRLSSGSGGARVAAASRV